MLEKRAMFAGLETVSVGAFCPEFEPADQTSIVMEASPKSTASKGPSQSSYSYTLIGNGADVVKTPLGGLAVMGGSADVDAAFKWLGERAAGGDFVVLSTTNNTYGSYINQLAGLDSVESLIVSNRDAANTEAVYDIISKAEAIFLPGGDQATYINSWKNTRVEDALYAALSRHAAIGGTSAGLAVLGDVDFEALNGSISSAEALRNPNDNRITVGNEFLSPNDAAGANTILRHMDDILLEPHFMQRDRMGRLLAFMSNMDTRDLVTNYPRAIAVNEQTALLVDEAGMATVVGNPYARKTDPAQHRRSVYLLTGTSPATTTSPLNYQVNVQSVTYDPNSTTPPQFAMTDWPTANSYVVNAISGSLSSPTKTNLYA